MYNLMLTASPDWNVASSTRVNVIVSSFALLNPLLLPGTLATSPDPTS